MPSQRVIRRQPLLQRLTAYPQDLLIWLNESWELLEWDNLSESLSIPVGIALNGLYIITRLNQGAKQTSYYDKDVFNIPVSYSLDYLNGTSSSGIHTLVIFSLHGL